MNGTLDAALDGIRVVALATNIPGPLAAARLHAMGASVIKIEPSRGDALEEAAPGWYADIVSGLEVIRLDLRDDADRAALHAHVAGADVLVTAMRDAALARLGLDWASLQRAHPCLSHIAVVGEAAPNADRAGHDLTYQARAGLLAPPAIPRTVLADLAAAERAVSAALAALVQRARTGRGTRVEVAIVDSAIEFAAPLRYGLTAPDGPLGGSSPLYDLYRASDGEWVAVAALEPHFIERLRALLGVESLDRATLERSLALRTAAEWEALGAERDIPLAGMAKARATERPQPHV
jgi:alpha-methylacyl-CoA racemase